MNESTTINERNFLYEIAEICVEYGMSYDELKSAIHYHQDFIELRLKEEEESE